jgi:very-short-patch-repair endonuclease
MANENARQRRKTATKSEGLLWAVLRGQQLSGLKFRREHPIEPWIVDFACVSKKLVIEVDGGYHDSTEERDRKRQSDLEGRGWKVVRFTAEQVEEDVEAVARAVAAAAGVEYQFDRRSMEGSGKYSSRAKKPKSK